jgi:hypothetical protein
MVLDGSFPTWKARTGKSEAFYLAIDLQKKKQRLIIGTDRTVTVWALWSATKTENTQHKRQPVGRFAARLYHRRGEGAWELFMLTRRHNNIVRPKWPERS